MRQPVNLLVGDGDQTLEELLDVRRLSGRLGRSRGDTVVWDTFPFTMRGGKRHGQIAVIVLTRQRALTYPLTFEDSEHPFHMELV